MYVVIRLSIESFIHVFTNVFTYVSMQLCNTCRVVGTTPELPQLALSEHGNFERCLTLLKAVPFESPVTAVQHFVVASSVCTAEGA